MEGLDLEKDLDILDGWEELDEEFQEKIKQAIRDGHVAVSLLQIYTGLSSEET